MSDLRAIYDRFAAAWAARDVETCVSLMTDDVQYVASIGPEPGRTYDGQDAVRAGITAMLAHDNAMTTEIVSFNVVGDTAYVEWRYDVGGGRYELGIDRIDFRDGKIWRKLAYRKVRAG